MKHSKQRTVDIYVEPQMIHVGNGGMWGISFLAARIDFYDMDATAKYIPDSATKVQRVTIRPPLPGEIAAMEKKKAEEEQQKRLVAKPELGPQSHVIPGSSSSSSSALPESRKRPREEEVPEVTMTIAEPAKARGFNPDLFD